MAYTVPAIEELVQALRQLPGVGPRSARRMAYTLLERKRPAMGELAAALRRADEAVGHCQRCNNLSDAPICGLCQSSRRDPRLLCVVETPADVAAIEATGTYDGFYFVLMGHLSPLDGVGPEALGIDRFEALLDQGFEEVVLATNPTVEGEATAHFLADLVRSHDLRATRIAHGVPVGGELEYVDRGTLSSALSGRRAMDD